MTTSPRGLSSVEATERLRSDGPNELPQSRPRSYLAIVVQVLREPMLLLLIGGGVIYLALGDLKEAAILLIFALCSVLITVIQETRTEKVLETLRDLTSPRALVIRDGKPTRIAGRDVVRGDVILVAEGDRVPADAALIEAQDILADESILTGESLPVTKRPRNPSEKQPSHPGGEGLPFIYSGTLIVRGRGTAEVLATGIASQIGQVGKSLTTIEPEAPRLQAQTRHLVLVSAILSAIVVIAVITLYGLFRSNWLEALLAGIAVGMSLLPEEFPMVLAVFMAMGAWRIARARVLTRRAVAIETLGSATILCTDKTGTLTENRMRVTSLSTDLSGSGAKVENGQFPASCRELAMYGALASAINPIDPMEKAFHELAAGLPPDAGRLVRTYGLTPTLLAMSNIWEIPGRQDLLVAAKGAPEAIAALCRLEPAGRLLLTRQVDEMASQGLRVIAVAAASATSVDRLPGDQREFDFRLIGLTGLSDPLRTSVPDAVAQCQSAGIRVVMITGDYPSTACAIAGSAGISNAEVLSGEELQQLDDAELARRIRTVSVFARTRPEQKLRLVSAFKRNGAVVGMTGDGVNDAPSLKAAHIGIAMGGRGTDVAREASAIVLLDDDFSSIVHTIRLGRRIFDNLRKAMAFILSVHIPIAGLALLPLLLGLPILFGPMHIAFLELIIDPVCSIAFEGEREEDDIMRRPPRDPQEPLFPTSMVLWSAVQGLFTLALIAGIFIIALGRGMPEDEVRALAFFALVVSLIALILVNRSFGSSVIKSLRAPNVALAIILPTVIGMLGLTLYWDWAAELFRFGPLHGDDLLLTAGAGVVVLLVLEAAKPLFSRSVRKAALRRAL